MTDIERLANILKASRRLVVFTGAGISVPSGIPDFRSADGLYNRDSGRSVPPEQIISRSFFDRDPAAFYEFYRSSMLYENAKPNKAHRFFARACLNCTAPSSATTVCAAARFTARTRF